MMKFEKKKFSLFKLILCFTVVYFNYNYSKWWLDAVQDEHAEAEVMCNLIILAAKNIK